MFDFKVKNHRDDILDLSTSPLYTVYKIEGLAPPQASINTSVNTTIDGSIINSARVESRNIVIYLAIEGNVEANRINLYKYFPVKKNITLYFKNGKRDVFIEGTVELIECDLFTNRQVAQISIICGKPYFKAVESLITTFNSVISLFEFPFSIPKEGIEFSAITQNPRQCIVNTGDVETGVVISLYAFGTVVNPTIYDVQKRTSIKLNYTLLPTDEVIINTNVGEKSITLLRDGESINLLGYMARGSEWFTLEAGDNVFTYESDSGDSGLQVTFTTSLLYSGV